MEQDLETATCLTRPVTNDTSIWKRGRKRASRRSFSVLTAALPAEPLGASPRDLLMRAQLSLCQKLKVVLAMLSSG